MPRLRQLNDDKKAMILRWYPEKPQAEIGRMLGVSRQNVHYFLKEQGRIIAGHKPARCDRTGLFVMGSTDNDVEYHRGFNSTMGRMAQVSLRATCKPVNI